MTIATMLQNLWVNTQNRTPADQPQMMAKEGAKAAVQHSGGSNVFALPTSGTGKGAADLSFHEQTDQPQIAARFKGLMNVTELEEFFLENHFGLGRHNGAHYRSQEAMELGKQSLISNFQNILDDLIGRRQEKINKLKLELIVIAGVSATMTEQLRLACEQLECEIGNLRTQLELAEAGKGWILEALNRYQIGFTKGLREAINFDLLSR